VLVLSTYPEDQFGKRVLKAGARGYVSQSGLMEGDSIVIGPSLRFRLSEGFKEACSPVRPHHWVIPCCFLARLPGPG
jgi:hypothetical protein